MYKNNLELKNISFGLSEEKDCKENYVCFEDNFIEYQKECDHQEKLDLTLRILYELIEEIVSEDNTIHIKKYDDIKKDIYIEKKRYYRIYGKVVDYKGISYKNILIRLFKYNFYCENIERVEIDKLFTNEFGEFNFVIEVNENTDLDSYKVEIDNYYKSF